MQNSEKRNIVTIGGGTGMSSVLNGLKNYDFLDLSAVVVVSDSGGSTGRLRDEFGFLPVGDMRQCLSALASGKNEKHIRDLLLYRFKTGDGLKGHNLGNLILTALADMSSATQAVEIASKIFDVKGHVYPVTESVVDLVINYQDGALEIGEHNLDDENLAGRKIRSICFDKPAEIYYKADRALRNAEIVVLGPGDLYASLLANTLVEGFKQALAKAHKFVYVVNLMTHFGQTHQMSAREHLEQVSSYCDRQPDVVIINNAKIDDELLDYYAKNKEYPVLDDLDALSGVKVIRDDYLSHVVFKQQNQDALMRSVLRHDSNKLAKTIVQLLQH